MAVDKSVLDVEYACERATLLREQAQTLRQRAQETRRTARMLREEQQHRRNCSFLREINPEPGRERVE